MAAVLYDNQNQDLIVMALLLDLLVLKAYLSQYKDLFYKMQISQHCLNNGHILPSRTHYRHRLHSVIVGKFHSVTVN